MQERLGVPMYEDAPDQAGGAARRFGVAGFGSDCVDGVMLPAQPAWNFCLKARGRHLDFSKLSADSVGL